MIQKFINQLQDFFGISKKEARGALVLMVLIFILLWTPFVFRRYILPLVPVPSQQVNTQRLDSIVAEIDKSVKIGSSENSYTTTDYNKTSKTPARLFRFDPNNASIAQLEELGIPGFLAKRMEKYRSKGGLFRKKEDLLHIYDFPAELFEKLNPYIILPETSAKTFASKENTKSFSEKPAANGFNIEVKTYSKPVIAPFDINTTDTTQLIKLKGIGTKLSLRILKFRDGLGGFHSTSQFSEIFGLDSLALSELNRYARVGSPVRKINVNSATLEELSTHSYLRNKKLAAVIVNYRNQHGNYSSLEDLKKVKVLDAATIDKIEPYLAF